MLTLLNSPAIAAYTAAGPRGDERLFIALPTGGARVGTDGEFVRDFEDEAE